MNIQQTALKRNRIGRFVTFLAIVAVLFSFFTPLRSAQAVEGTLYPLESCPANTTALDANGDPYFGWTFDFPRTWDGSKYVYYGSVRMGYKVLDCKVKVYAQVEDLEGNKSPVVSSDWSGPIMADCDPVEGCYINPGKTPDAYTVLTFGDYYNTPKLGATVWISWGFHYRWEPVLYANFHRDWVWAYNGWTYNSDVPGSLSLGSYTVGYPDVLNKKPVALFSAKQNSSNPLNVLFTDLSTDSDGDAIVGWNWNFGDTSVGATNNTSTLKNPNHTYLNYGTYTVTLRVQDARGGLSSIYIGSVAVEKATTPTIKVNSNVASTTIRVYPQFVTNPNVTLYYGKVLTADKAVTASSSAQLGQYSASCPDKSASGYTVTDPPMQTLSSTNMIIVFYCNYVLESSLAVTISPAAAVTAGAQWRLDKQAWYGSGVAQTGVTPGSHTISFLPVTGWTTPADKVVNIVAGANMATATYVQQLGSLTVNISPSAVVTSSSCSSASPVGACWRLDKGTWRSSGAAQTGITPGSHSISFLPVTGWTTPADQIVNIVFGANTATAAYAQQTGGIRIQSNLSNTTIVVNPGNYSGTTVTPGVAVVVAPSAPVGNYSASCPTKDGYFGGTPSPQTLVAGTVITFICDYTNLDGTIKVQSSLPGGGVRVYPGTTVVPGDPNSFYTATPLANTLYTAKSTAAIGTYTADCYVQPGYTFTPPTPQVLNDKETIIFTCTYLSEIVTEGPKEYIDNHAYTKSILVYASVDSDSYTGYANFDQSGTLTYTLLITNLDDKNKTINLMYYLPKGFLYQSMVGGFTTAPVTSSVSGGQGLTWAGYVASPGDNKVQFRVRAQ